jgi:hypothetical protein
MLATAAVIAGVSGHRSNSNPNTTPTTTATASAHAPAKNTTNVTTDPFTVSIKRSCDDGRTTQFTVAVKNQTTRALVLHVGQGRSYTRYTLNAHASGKYTVAGIEEDRTTINVVDENSNFTVSSKHINC